LDEQSDEHEAALKLWLHELIVSQFLQEGDFSLTNDANCIAAIG
jgi:hypothetical protein